MSPITQIIYLNIPPDRDLKEPKPYHGRLWSSALDLIEQSEGFQRLYWGRSLEQPQNVQLHVGRSRTQISNIHIFEYIKYCSEVKNLMPVRTSLKQHETFNKSHDKHKFIALLNILASSGSANPIRAVRHVAMNELTPNCKALGRGAPFTGSAIYLRPTAAWYEGAWPLWTHIVRYVDGCMGCAGGTLLEPVELLSEPVLVGEVKSERDKRKGAKWEGYLVYVGWETVEKHEAYHHTKHFREHSVVLRCGNEGYAEYGHVVFEGEREASASTGAKL